MEDKKMLFLSGCMSYYYNLDRPELAEQWRRDVENQIEGYDFLKNNFKVFNPCKNFYKNSTYSSKGIVHQNLFYLRKSGIILLNLADLDKSPGTIFEIVDFYLDSKPVIAFGENNLYTNMQPHIHEAITHKCRDLNEAMEYLCDVYGQ